MTLFILGLAIFLADQAIKRYILFNFTLRQTREFIPGVLQLTYVQNTGAAFRILENHQWFIMLLSSLLIVLLVVMLARGVFRCRIQQWAVATVIGGALGNLADRLIHGFVIDMFEPIFVRFAVFNLADSAIVIGGIVFVIAYLIDERRREGNSKDSADA